MYSAGDTIRERVQAKGVCVLTSKSRFSRNLGRGGGCECVCVRGEGWEEGREWRMNGCCRA